jgi:hypothetical protein
VLAGLAAARGAAALPPADVAGRPVLVEVTDATSVIYNTDNRDSVPLDVPSAVNDDVGFVYNRLNLHATSEPFRLSMRLDGAWFFTSPTPDGIASELVQGEPDPALRADLYRTKATEAGIELSNRYINWLYPTKYTLSYASRNLEVSLGDNSAQLGRGLVLSLRKADELSSDTTLRGARVSAAFGKPGGRVKLVLLGGSLNPLRIDESSGRYLGVHSSVTPGFVAITEAGMPRAVATDFTPEAADCARFGTCSYAPDRMLAGGVEIDVAPVKLGTQASWLLRGEPLGRDTVRSAGRILTASQSAELVRLGDAGSAYVEAALQKLSEQSARAEAPPLGHAVYLATSWVDDDFSVLVEGKHYRRFFPLLANVSTARAREFSQVQYNAPPTTEEVTNDTQFENFNTCVTGARVRGEARASAKSSVHASLGHYRTWAESASNSRCEIRPEFENRIWDTAVGLERRLLDGKLELSVGTRLDSAQSPLEAPDGRTHVYYREENLRYTLAVPLSDELGLEIDGHHRRRRQTLGGYDAPWFESLNTAGIEWGERLAVSLGFEYDEHAKATTYLNAHVTYHPTDALVLALFAGQRNGSLRCVGGVCRVYPPFEGARLDATLRF